MHPVAIPLPGTHPGQQAMPHPEGAFDQRHPLLLALGGEQAHVHGRCDRGGHRETHPAALGVRAERERSADVGERQSGHGVILPGPVTIPAVPIRTMAG